MALYHGWDFAAMRDVGDNAASQSDGYRPPTAFTPINRPAQHQLLTPQSSAAAPPTEQHERPNRGKQRGKRHNVLVAQCLGFGAETETEPVHLAKYAAASPAALPTPLKGRKRSRKERDGSTTAGDETRKQKASKQSRVSDGLRATKAGARTVTSKMGTEDAARSVPFQNDELLPISHVDQANAPGANQHQATKPQQARKRIAPEIGALSAQLSSTDNKAPQVETSLNSPCPTTSRSGLPITESSVARRLAEHDSQDTITEDGIDDIFDMIELDHTNDFSTTNVRQQRVSAPQQHEGHEKCALNAHYECVNVAKDENIFVLTPSTMNESSSPDRPRCVEAQSSGPPLTKSIVDRPTGDLHSDRSRGPSRKFISPVISKAQAPFTQVLSTIARNRKPIVRLPFPPAVRDRSPVIGLSPNLLLRTCFRIGEAISQACHAGKHGQNIVFELYARVLTSMRDTTKQHVVLCDLFHNKPPYIQGTYDATIWKHVQLHEYDSGRFLERDGSMCRCIGTIKRDGKEWVMVVLNIWETTWEDVAWVEGIVTS